MSSRVVFRYTTGWKITFVCHKDHDHQERFRSWARMSNDDRLDLFVSPPDVPDCGSVFWMEPDLG